MDRISTYQKAKADQDQELSEAIDKFVRGETVTCPSLDEWSINLRELKAEHFDQVLQQAEELKAENARLERELAKANERIKDLECLQGEQLDRLAKENQELRLRLVPNGTETSAVLKVKVARLEKECDRMTARYIDATNRVPEPILPDCPMSDSARKIIDNLR